MKRKRCLRLLTRRCLKRKYQCFRKLHIVTATTLNQGGFKDHTIDIVTFMVTIYVKIHIHATDLSSIFPLTDPVKSFNSSLRIKRILHNKVTEKHLRYGRIYNTLPVCLCSQEVQSTQTPLFHTKHEWPPHHTF